MIPPPPTAMGGIPEMPDVTDTGTIIGNLAPQPPLDRPMLISSEDDDSVEKYPTTDAAMLEEDENERAPIDEEDALRTIELLRGDDTAGRVSAARKLHSIASALGPERTRDELLPFLSDGIDDEDEVLEAVAVSLGKLVPYVGGARHAKSLLPTLELLLAVEEGVVRDKASASAVMVSGFMNEDEYRREFVGMIGRLATKEWFTARISACGLIPIAFPKMSVELQVRDITLD